MSTNLDSKPQCSGKNMSLDFASNSFAQNLDLLAYYYIIMIYY